MNHVQFDQVPSLRSPAMIMAFAGWNDAGQAATAAVDFLVKDWSAQQFGSIDPEDFFDFTSARPLIRLTPGAQRELDWPGNTFFHKADPALRRDFVLLLGTEPHLKWRAFTEAVLHLARQCGVSLVVGLGAFLGDTPHSRSVPLTGFATEAGLAERLAELGITPSRYEGPTGIVGTIHDACRRQGLAALSLWAAVPHYLGTTTNPKAAAALLASVNVLLDLHLDLGGLQQETARFEAEVSEAVARNPEVAAYVQELERRSDALPQQQAAEAGGAELPSGDVLVEELEEFLKRRREEEEER